MITDLQHIQIYCRVIYFTIDFLFRDIARQERRRAENLKELQLQQELTREYKRAEAKDQMAVSATPQ